MGHFFSNAHIGSSYKVNIRTVMLACLSTFSLMPTRQGPKIRKDQYFSNLANEKDPQEEVP